MECLEVSYAEEFVLVFWLNSIVKFLLRISPCLSGSASSQARVSLCEMFLYLQEDSSSDTLAEAGMSTFTVLLGLAFSVFNTS